MRSIRVLQSVYDSLLSVSFLAAVYLVSLAGNEVRARNTSTCNKVTKTTCTSRISVKGSILAFCWCYCLREVLRRIVTRVSPLRRLVFGSVATKATPNDGSFRAGTFLTQSTKGAFGQRS